MISCLLAQLFQEQQLWLASQRWCLFPARFNPESQTSDAKTSHKTWSNKMKRDCVAASVVLPLWSLCLLPGQHYSLNGVIALGFLGCICFLKYFSAQKEKAARKERAWSWMWTRAIMNIYLILQKTKASGYSSALVILTWNQCIMSYLSCFMPNVTCSVGQMTASDCSIKILHHADIGWRKKLFCIPSSPAEDQHHTN